MTNIPTIQNKPLDDNIQPIKNSAIVEEKVGNTIKKEPVNGIKLYGGTNDNIYVNVKTATDFAKNRGGVKVY